jgi:hypothetical protein
MSGAPTASRLTLVSDRDRHLFHFGTETTIGTYINTRSNVHQILESGRL